MTTTVVVPCFNEAERLDVEAFAGFDAIPVEFLFVDDASTDTTGEILDALAERDPVRYRVMRLNRNLGKAEAVRRGIVQALEGGADYVGFIDADLSTPLGELPALVGVLDAQPDVLSVIGSRVRLLGRRIDRRLFRHLTGRVFATFASLVLRLPVYDTQCGAKFFRASPAMVGVFGEPFASKWIFDVELLARLEQIGLAAGRPPGELLVEYPLTEWRHVAGSKLRLRHGLRAVVDLIRIWRRYRPR